MTRGTHTMTRGMHSTTQGVVESGEDAQGPRHRLQTASQVVQHVKGGYRIWIIAPVTSDGDTNESQEAEPEYLVRYGSQGVFVVGLLETPVYCGTTDRQDFTPRVIAKVRVSDASTSWRHASPRVYAPSPHAIVQM